MVITKSPVNDAILLSYVGGSIGGEIKYAGYDAIILDGMAEKPVVVELPQRYHGRAGAQYRS